MEGLPLHGQGRLGADRAWMLEGCSSDLEGIAGPEAPDAVLAFTDISNIVFLKSSTVNKSRILCARGQGTLLFR